MAVQTDMEILGRLLNAAGGSLSRGAAEGLLSLQFASEDISQMNVLAEKARDGDLSPEQQREADSYNRVGHLIALLHSKARLTLKRVPEGDSGR